VFDASYMTPGLSVRRAVSPGEAPVSEIAFYVVILVGLAIPLGAYMARVYRGTPNKVERLLYRLFGVDPGQGADLEAQTLDNAIAMMT